MIRERALKVVRVLVGLFFVAGVYPILMSLRNPSAHRSLIAFAAWSSFALAVVMSTLGLELRTGFLIGSGVLVVIGVVLLALLPAHGRQSELQEFSSGAEAQG